ncbi:MAG: type II toxin-antitoxin system VapC family toxin [Polaromonas sp.]|nr:type II toxin-antitoxin system VapC family toxin [Polaromonas sp.]
MLMDTSALFKRYNLENGRDQVLAAGQRASELVIAGHCRAEIASALNRQRHDGVLNADDYERIMAVVTDDFKDLTVFGLDGRVESFAISAMEVSRLRTMDALHIGTAKAAHVDLFVTADRRQAAAAQAVGLKTELIEA